MTDAMRDWLHARFAEALGWTLLHSAWQILVVAAGVAAMMTLLRRRSAQVRYVVAYAGLVTMVAGLVGTYLWILPPAPRRAVATAAPVMMAPPVSMELLPALPFVPVGESIANPVAAPVEVPLMERVEAWMKAKVSPWLPEAVVLYLLGVGIIFLRLVVGFVQVQRVGAMAMPVRGPVAGMAASMLETLCARLRIPRRVRLMGSEVVEVPTLLGVWRPIILLPASALMHLGGAAAGATGGNGRGLTPEQLAALLAHELAHIRRHDYLANLMQSVLETLLFYHPAAWWLSGRIRQERENCCDDVAVEITRDRLVYARALATMEELRGSPIPAKVAVAARGGDLLSRIRRLLGGTPNPAPVWGMSVVAMAVVMAAGLVYVGCNRQSDAPSARPAPVSAAPVTIPPTAAMTVESVVASSSEGMVVRVYDIRDMLVQADSIGERAEAEHQTLVNAIFDTIRSTIAPESWEGKEGTGSLRERNGQLLVSQTPANQAAVLSLITKLREARAIQIGVETRLLLVAPSYFDDFRFEWNLAILATGGEGPMSNEPLGQHRSWPASIIDNGTLSLMLNSTNDTMTLSKTAPRITLFNGGSATLATHEVPGPRALPDVSNELSATVSADRRYVVLSMRPSLLAPGAAPAKDNARPSTMVSVPDNGTLLMNAGSIDTPRGKRIALVFLRPQINVHRVPENDLFGVGYDRPTPPANVAPAAAPARPPQAAQAAATPNPQQSAVRFTAIDNMVHEFYRIDDIVGSDPAALPQRRDVLVRTIREKVAPESWQGTPAATIDDRMTETLLILQTRANHRAILSLLQETRRERGLPQQPLGPPVKQVLLKATVAEMAGADIMALSGFEPSLTPGNPRRGAVQALGLSVGFVGDSTAYVTRAAELERAGQWRVLGKPSVLLLNKQVGSLQTAEPLSYVLGFVKKNPADAGSEWVSQTSRVETSPHIGIVPYVKEDGFIQLELRVIQPRLVRMEESPAPGIPATANLKVQKPIVEATETTTTLMVKDGRTVIIGLPPVAGAVPAGAPDKQMVLVLTASVEGEQVPGSPSAGLSAPPPSVNPPAWLPQAEAAPANVAARVEIPPGGAPVNTAPPSAPARQVAVESRMLLVSNNFLDDFRIGWNLKVPVVDGGARLGDAPNAALIDNWTLSLLLNAVQADRRTVTITAPRLTLSSGDTGVASVTNRGGVVSRYAEFESRYSVMLHVKPLLSADGGNLELALAPHVVTPMTDTRAEPALTPVKIPDGGFLVIRGGRFTQAGEEREMLILVRPNVVRGDASNDLNELFGVSQTPPAAQAKPSPTTQPTATAPTLPAAAADQTTPLKPGDGVYISIFELITPGLTYSIEQAVDPQGNIELPTTMLGIIRATGLTPAQLQAAIVAKFMEFQRVTWNPPVPEIAVFRTATKPPPMTFQEHKKKVAALIGDAKKLYDTTQFTAALDLLTEATRLDPTDVNAALMRRLVEDKIIQRDPEFVTRRAGDLPTTRPTTAPATAPASQPSAIMRQRIDSAENLVPYADLMVYPDQWPEITRRRAERDGDSAVRAKLQAPLKEFRMEKRRLEDAVNAFRDAMGANIFVNWPALAQAGVQRDTPVSVDLKDVPARKVLTAILADAAAGKAELSYTIDDGIITISTIEDLSSQKYQIVRVFDVRDILAGTPGRIPTPIDADARQKKAEELMAKIRATIAPNTWRDGANPVGSIGSMRELNGQLIVNQTIDNQTEIFNFIQEQRATEGQVLIKGMLFSISAKYPEVAKLNAANGVGKDEAIRAILQKLEQDAAMEVISRPTLLAKAGEDAEMLIGQHVPSISAYRQEPTGEWVPVTEYKDVGIKIRLNTTIDKDTVKLDGDATVSVLVRTERTPDPAAPASAPRWFTRPVIVESIAKVAATLKNDQMILVRLAPAAGTAVEQEIFVLLTPRIAESK